VTFAYCTGWRVNSEILPLQWPQVDMQAGTVRLEPGTTKNDRGRLIKFHDLEELHAAIEDQWAIHEELRHDGIICPWVFPHTTPVRKRGHRIRTYRRSWLSACRHAGIAGRIPHDFRRTAVRNLERAGVPRSVAMQMTGHLTESVYRRYDIVSDADLTAAAKQLNAAFVRGA
jgi:integrase